MNKLAAKWNALFSPAREVLFRDIALLALRISFGLMMMTHGWAKLSSFAEKSGTFPDPLHVGHATSLSLAIFAEFFCSIALIFGVATRFAAFNLLFTMGVAAFVIHGGDPFGKKELALAYLFAYLALILMGPGRFSIDALVRGKLSASADK